MDFIEIPALSMAQSPGKIIYAFGIDAKTIPEFATVSRDARDDEGELLGYQRPEVRRHIADIRGYIESEAPMIPNALVLAFDNRVRFITSGPKSDTTTPGVLRIPIATGNENKVGWIVDGQQRVAAVRDAKVASFPLFAIAFIADTDSMAREQFMLVNSTKPLPRNLVYELLPGVEAHMPAHLAKRKLPAQLLQTLNYNRTSPLYLSIATATNAGARIKDNSILKCLENSLADGVLYRVRMSAGPDSHSVMLQVLFDYWAAVRDTWPELWELKPRHSRLLHGAGIVTLGYLMDAISDQCPDGTWPAYSLFMAHLSPIKPHCHWNEGYWDFGADVRRKWNDVQNTSKDVNLLANHLTRKYQQWVRQIARS